MVYSMCVYVPSNLEPHTVQYIKAIKVVKKTFDFEKYNRWLTSGSLHVHATFI